MPGGLQSRYDQNASGKIATVCDAALLAATRLGVQQISSESRTVRP